MTIEFPRPRHGQLIPLRTKAEVSATQDIVHVYVAEVPAKVVNGLIQLVRRRIPNAIASLQHLQRVARWENLPAHVQTTFRDDTHVHEHPDTGVVSEAPNGQGDGGPGSTESSESDDASLAPTPSTMTAGEPVTLYFLVSRIEAVDQAELTKLLSSHPSLEDTPTPLTIRTVAVPRLLATSEQQARQQSIDYWPTIYRNGNPYGPHPSIVARARDEIAPRAGLWVAMAYEAARQVASTDAGEAIGAAVVDRSASASGSLVLVAGDARWCARRKSSNDGGDSYGGNAMNHAAMRAIGMVARKRRSLLDETMSSTATATATDDSGLYIDRPMTRIEETAFAADVLAPRGYLCVGLDLYLTHEPCIMCSMAMLHSRFDRVVFAQPMPLTGGLMAETVLSASASRSPRSTLASKPVQHVEQNHNGGGLSSVSTTEAEGFWAQGIQSDNQVNGKYNPDPTQIHPNTTTSRDKLELRTVPAADAFSYPTVNITRHSRSSPHSLEPPEEPARPKEIEEPEEMQLQKLSPVVPTQDKQTESNHDKQTEFDLKSKEQDKQTESDSGSKEPEDKERGYAEDALGYGLFWLLMVVMGVMGLVGVMGVLGLMDVMRLAGVMDWEDLQMMEV
ncbi:MAG: tRNA-specific adenosine deaminase subunit tad3 [Lichina confinis]|nr:MAG: tRNA-specific adenosine deaminase subunit tad3 [Lichina confinis]